MLLNWTTEKRKIKDLILWEKNPRKLSPMQKLKLEESLARFNLVEIPVINLDNKIIAGHQRVGILQALGKGEEEIDVRVPNRMLTDAEFTEYNLRSNKNTGDFDFDILKELGADAMLTSGFEQDEINLILGIEEPAKLPDGAFTKVKSFTFTEEHHALLESALELAEAEGDLVQYGKKPRTSDKLLVIIKEWLKRRD